MSVATVTELFRDFLAVKSVWFALLVILVAWLLFFPEKVEKFRAGFFWALGILSASFRRQFHRSAIRGFLNPQLRSLEGQLGLEEKLPRIDIRFLKTGSDTKPAFSNGNVILFLRDTRGFRSENIVKAALAYVNAALYPESRPYVNETTERALDLVLTKRLIRDDRDAFTHFTRYFVADACSVDEDLKGIYGCLVASDERGLLPNVLLHQLSLLAARLYPEHMYSPDIQQEVVGFIRWLATIARRGPGQEVLLQFNVRYIRVGLVLMGKDETLRERGFAPYKENMARMIMQQYHGAYILAAGHKIGLVKRMISALENNAYFSTKISQTSVSKAVSHVSADKHVAISIGYVPILPHREVSDPLGDPDIEADYPQGHLVDH